MNKFEKQLTKHILNEKYLGETEEEKMTKEERNSFLEAVANYHKLGEMIYSSAKLKEVTETLKSVVERAEKVTMSESEHWFDNVTVSRHMKQMNEAMKVFEKTAGEMNGLQQRLESAYEDMGTVLNRYYKIGEALDEDGYTAGVDDGAAALEEDSYTAGIDDKRAGDSVPYPGKDM
jgi:division protein CdvB (Snf7/Vps24/ESCRT-III family)